MSQELPGSFKLLTIWLLIGATVFLGIQWWLRESQQTRFQIRGDEVHLQRGMDGHYHWPGRVNGRKVDFLVDTGATSSALPASLARELGLASQGKLRSQTAGGVAIGDRVTADLELQGGIKVERLRFASLPGLDDYPLLGMDVLGGLHLQQLDGVLRIDLRERR
jgi:aspartyl protease family protein